MSEVDEKVPLQGGSPLQGGPLQVSDGSLFVPPFIQIITCSAAFGRGAEDVSPEALYGLANDGSVWQYLLADPDREGSTDGWQLLPQKRYQEGKASNVRKTR